MDLIYHLIYDIYNKDSDIEVYIFFVYYQYLKLIN